MDLFVWGIRAAKSTPAESKAEVEAKKSRGTQDTGHQRRLRFQVYMFIIRPPPTIVNGKTYGS